MEVKPLSKSSVLRDLCSGWLGRLARRLDSAKLSWMASSSALASATEISYNSKWDCPKTAFSDLTAQKSKKK